MTNQGHMNENNFMQTDLSKTASMIEVQKTKYDSQQSSPGNKLSHSTYTNFKLNIANAQTNSQ